MSLVKTLGLGLLALSSFTSTELFAQGGVTRFCTSGANGATIAATGSADFNANAGAGDLVLHADGLPGGSLGLFFYGASAQAANPLGGGFLCVGGGAPVWRLGVVGTAPGEQTVSWSLDYQAPPAAGAQIAPGSTWNFQFWFRDGASSDLTDALEIQFVPPQPVGAFTTIVDMPRTGHPLGQTFEGGVVVMNTYAELRDFWELHTAPWIPQPPLPSVDMSQETLIAVVNGRRFTSGYDHTIDGLALSVTTLDVSTTEYQPGLGCGTLFSEMNPVHVISIPKIPNVVLGTWNYQVNVYTCP